MPTKLWLVAVDTDTGATFHIDEPDADVHVETTEDRGRVTVHVRRKGAGGEWPPGPPVAGYLLFAGGYHYPLGGAQDLQGHHATPDAAQAAGFALAFSTDDGGSVEWWHVYGIREQRVMVSARVHDRWSTTGPRWVEEPS
jgi:hypothetical protein